MNPPKLEICFEGYNTDQTDFYIGQLIERINRLESAYDMSKERIASLEAENKQLRSELLLFIRQTRTVADNDASESDTEAEIQVTESTDATVNESKNEVNTAIRESLKALQLELASVKEFIKNN